MKVWGGTEEKVAALSEEKGFLLPKTAAIGIESKIRLQEEITAPVTKGQVLGTLSYEKDGVTLQEFPIVAEKDVPALGVFDVFKRLLSITLWGK